MSDLIVNVRQISQYTAQTQAQASDNLLIQRGGQGGAYYSLPVSGIVGAFTGPTGQIGIGLPLPGDASSTGIIGSNLLMPLGCTFGWNWYRTATGTSYLAAGYALQECFSGSGLTINAAPSGSPGQPVTAWSQILNLALNGTLTIPGTLTAAPATATSQMATLGQVNAAVAAAVTSFNGRTGAVSLTLADVTGVGGAPTNSPTFTGVPAALTAAANSNSAQLATTMYVDRAVSTLQANSVTSFNTRQGAVTLTLTDVTGVGGAPAANPIFTGVPITPTAAPGTNTQQIASTQFVTNAVTTLQTNSVNSFNGRTGVVGLTTNDITNAGGAPIASPAFSGLPNAPTAAPGTSTSQLATTAFVQAAITASVGGVASFNTRTGAVLKLATPPTEAVMAACTNAVVANWLVDVPGAAVGALGRPEKAGEAIGAPPALVMSFVVRPTTPVRPLKELTELVCRVVTALVTNWVLAICWVLVPGAAVGVIGTPVKIGLAAGAPPTPVTSVRVSVTTPWRVLKEVTEFACSAATALVTKAVVASVVLLVAGAGVGAVGVPDRLGLASGAPPAPVISAKVSVTAPVRPLKLVTAAATAALTWPSVAAWAVEVAGAAVMVPGMVSVPFSARLRIWLQAVTGWPGDPEGAALMVRPEPEKHSWRA